MLAITYHDDMPSYAVQWRTVGSPEWRFGTPFDDSIGRFYGSFDAVAACVRKCRRRGFPVMVQFRIVAIETRVIDG